MDIEIQLDGRKVTVLGAEFFRGSKGPRDCWGAQEEADEEDSWEWDDIVDEDGEEVQLTDEEWDSVERGLNQAMEDR